MTDATQWYLDWTPDALGYSRDDVIIAIGLQCSRHPIKFDDILLWLGDPDKGYGTTEGGQIAYFFEGQDDTAALFDVIDDLVQGFGTVTRKEDNTLRMNETTGEQEPFNILDEMEDFASSVMKKSTEPENRGDA